MLQEQENSAKKDKKKDEEEKILAENEFYFYHISRNASNERVRSFENGISGVSGTGYGGQSSGFYCWTNEEQANKYFASLAIGADVEWAKKNFGIDISLKNGDALKIEVIVPASSVCFPNFQLDNEQHPNISRGRERSIWLDFWESQKHIFNDKDFTFEDKVHGSSYEGIAWDDEKRCPVLLMKDVLGNEKKKYIETTNSEDSELTQKINDYFCFLNPEFSKNYNVLVKAVAKNEPEIEINGKVLHTQNIAIKYCGLALLDNFKISRMHTNFGTNEKLSCTQTVSYNDKRVSFNEVLLFMTHKALNNKLANLRKKSAKIADKTLKHTGAEDKPKYITKNVRISSIPQIIETQKTQEV